MMFFLIKTNKKCAERIFETAKYNYANCGLYDKGLILFQ